MNSEKAGGHVKKNSKNHNRFSFDGYPFGSGGLRIFFGQAGCSESYFRGRYQYIYFGICQ